MLLGLTGFQVFTGTGAGMLYLFGPTGGYIAGFLLASFLAGGLFIQRGQGWRAVFFKLLFADLAILFCGTFWLKASLSLPLGQAFLIGFLPFIPGDIFKVIFAAALHRKLHSRIKAAIY